MRHTIINRDCWFDFFRNCLTLIIVGMSLSGCCTAIPASECNIDKLHASTAPSYPFHTDGCSMAPDDGVKCCCVKHDIEYWQGGTSDERKEADKEFKQCMIKEGHPYRANIYYATVSILGTPYLPTCWRWGFGWDYGRGYRAKDDDK